MQKVKNLCSLNPNDSWYVSDVTTDSSCVCPPDQIQVTKQLGDTTLYKCQLSNNTSTVDSVDASSTRNLSNPNNPNNRNNPFTQNNPSKQNNIYNSTQQGIQQNPSFNTTTCDETPYTLNPSDWNGLSTDSTCYCPDPLTQKNTKINNNSYYTCSWSTN